MSTINCSSLVPAATSVTRGFSRDPHGAVTAEYIILTQYGSGEWQWIREGRITGLVTPLIPGKSGNPQPSPNVP